jgi:hypothetical protein
MTARKLHWMDVDGRPTDGPPGKLCLDAVVVGHVWRADHLSEKSWLWQAGGKAGIPFIGCGIKLLSKEEAREKCVRYVLSWVSDVEIEGGVPPPQEVP